MFRFRRYSASYVPLTPAFVCGGREIVEVSCLAAGVAVNQMTDAPAERLPERSKYIESVLDLCKWSDGLPRARRGN